MRLARLLVVVAVAAAGCLGMGGGGDRVEVSGSPATLAPDAGYEHTATRNRTLNATITVTLQGDIEGRESQAVTATVPVATYRSSTDPPTVVAVASSPSVEVIENPPRSGDPLATLSTTDLVAFVQSTYTDPADLEEGRTRTVTALGTEGKLVSYRGTATYEESTIEIQAHVIRIPHDGDVVTVVVVGPADADEPSLDPLLGAIEH